jgi:hypothetical protein
LKPAKFFAAQEHFPRLLDVLLSETKRAFAGIPIGLKAQNKNWRFGGLGKVAPFPSTGNAQVMQAAIKKALIRCRWYACQEENRGDQNVITLWDHLFVKCLA